MNSVSSIKTNSAESPKTPGGISKALLTPCRRVGLSRKWKKGGPSPFISPLSSATSSNEVKEETVLRKRKKRSAEEPEVETGSTRINECDAVETNVVSCNTPKIGNNRTPSRSSLLRKKSKIQLTSEECQDQIEGDNISQTIRDLNYTGEPFCNYKYSQQDPVKHGSKVSKLSRKNSSKSVITEKTTNVVDSVICTDKPLKIANSVQLCNKESIDVNCTQKQKSPNNLSKECIVVIQKKIFKIDHSKVDKCDNDQITKKKSSQTLFDSEEDDVPLSSLNSNIKLKDICDTAVTEKENIKNLKEVGPSNSELIRDDDFVAKKRNTVKSLENKTTSTSGLNAKLREKNKISKSIKKSQTVQTPKSISQSSNSVDDDDDFDFDKRKTIVIKRSYDKVMKPSKAKSTGSITQKDIDEIKARIESKKNLLLVREMSNETKELRDLIKKWQLGCQSALTELLELMKKKMPEQKMNYSELLQMLKIPQDLVGYDSENDCFNTPDDTKIILSAL